MFDIFDAIDAAFDGVVNESTRKNVVGSIVPNFPPCEMLKDKDGTIRLVFAVSGYKKEDIVVSTQENKIIVSTVEGYKKPEKPEGTIEIVPSTLKRSAFKSSVGIPETKFNFNEISAKREEDGTLVITIPPKEKKEYKTINID